MVKYCMGKFIKECWNDWLLVESELAKEDIFRIYTVYGVFEYYNNNTVKKENTNESKSSNVD
jgi:hypothetical protein